MNNITQVCRIDSGNSSTMYYHFQDNTQSLEYPVKTFPLALIGPNFFKAYSAQFAWRSFVKIPSNLNGLIPEIFEADSKYDSAPLVVLAEVQKEQRTPEILSAHLLLHPHSTEIAALAVARWAGSFTEGIHGARALFEYGDGHVADFTDYVIQTHLAGVELVKKRGLIQSRFAPHALPQFLVSSAVRMF